MQKRNGKRDQISHGNQTYLGQKKGTKRGKSKPLLTPVSGFPLHPLEASTRKQEHTRRARPTGPRRTSSPAVLYTAPPGCAGRGAGGFRDVQLREGPGPKVLAALTSISSGDTGKATVKKSMVGRWR